MNVFTLLRREKKEPRKTRRDKREETRDGWPRSLWRDTNRRFFFQSPAVDLDADVLIVGAGFSGLWTAAHLKMSDPGLNIVVIDAHQPGFGASGRNGGWCSALVPTPPDRIAEETSIEATVALQRRMFGVVDEIGAFVSEHGIDCDWAKGGSLTVATNGAHAGRLRSDMESLRQYGFGEEDLRWLGTDELAGRIAVNGALGATFTPHCAALNPYRLLDGLVQFALDSGVRIFGATRVFKIGNGYAEARGENGLVFVTSRHTVVATEAYTTRLRKHKRSVVPLYSYVVATDPIPESVWAEIGWTGRETVADGRNMVTYAQRTGDGRIVFGGRGAPYKFGSDIHSEHDTSDRVHSKIVDTLHEMFPQTRNVRISHRWGGPLGVPRDWHPSVTSNPLNGAIHVGGYVGDGVALSYLAAQVVAARITGNHPELLDLPINGHTSRKWEPEPLRWLGINAGLLATRLADRRERRTGRQSRVLNAFMKLF
ncbi:MAG: hypothetical protein RL430_475 [Actinomycetota bacterium]|jgi:glycine/D-amino acid oxidase-like deaminating enzyme